MGFLGASGSESSPAMSAFGGKADITKAGFSKGGH